MNFYYLDSGAPQLLDEPAGLNRWFHLEQDGRWLINKELFNKIYFYCSGQAVYFAASAASLAGE